MAATHITTTATKEETPKVIYLRDYKAAEFAIETCELSFRLQEDSTIVENKMNIRRQPHVDAQQPLVLHGEAQVLELLAISINGQPLAANSYKIEAESLTIQIPSSLATQTFELSISTKINPAANTALSGLYISKNIFCTQCEAHGFRRITYYLDRPDVMSTFTTTIIADKSTYPVLLSNGNLLEKGDAENNQHWVKWHDPFKKPSYLFALVAGDLACVEDSYTTMSKRNVDLRIFVEHGNEDKCAHAMRSLKASMAWDEKAFGREYDLDIFMIVAVSSFNMGAMENKGLNIFNDKYILAKPEIATDLDYQNIETVVGHEYFHNWTGNRVTCRDWFQLSLKEGLMVFREQSFAADNQDADVARIDNVQILRTHQFAEDAGPMAHPVRPSSYIEINNFYTATIYNKGAEVIRMMSQLLGTDGFRKGMDLYFQRHDGQAVTTDDFVKAMEDANAADLQQFRRWYEQAGTPELTIKTTYDQQNQQLQLTVSQHTAATPGQTQKKPFHIPLAMGLLDTAGKAMPVQLNATDSTSNTKVLSIKDETTTFKFVNIKDKPTVSLLRGFSAPVKLKLVDSEDNGNSDASLMLLMAHDSDGFARWEAAQVLASRKILQVADIAASTDRQQLTAQLAQIAQPLLEAYQHILQDQKINAALKARLLQLPREQYLFTLVDSISVATIHQARKIVANYIAKELRETWLDNYSAQSQYSYQLTPEAMGMRSLRNICLSYLMRLEEQDIVQICLQQLKTANNMTDELAALQCLANYSGAERIEALAGFYQKWQHESLVVDKWLTLQACSELPNTLLQVKQLMQHQAFDINNPNKIRAVVGAFCQANISNFHMADGQGYKFLAEQVLLLNKRNPQIAARLLSPLQQWRKFVSPARELMEQQLQVIKSAQDLSPDVYEIVSKYLA